MKKNDPKSRVEYAELCKTVRKYVTEDIRKFNCDLVQKVLEDNKSLKSARAKLCDGRKGIFVLKTPDVTIPKINKEIAHIVEKFYNDLYKFEDQREINLRDPRENLTETEAIIPVMTEEVLRAIKFIKKGKSQFLKSQLLITLQRDSTSFEGLVEGETPHRPSIGGVYFDPRQLGGNPQGNGFYYVTYRLKPFGL